MSNTSIVPLIKTIVLSIALFVESFFLTSLMAEYARLHDYFTPPVNIVILLGVGLLLLAYTYAFTIGAWVSWEQFVIVPVPVCLGIFLVTMRINIVYALVLTAVCLVLLTYDIYFATSLKAQLVTFKPRLILRFSTKGLLFIFALVAAAIILMEPASKNIDVSGLIADEVGEQAEKLVKSSPTFQPLNQYGLTDMLDISGTVKKEVDTFIGSYRDYVLPILAFVALGFIQFLNLIVYLIFSLTIGLLFRIAKGLHFFRVEKETIEREILKF